MIKAKLGVTTCDKCQEPMKKEQPVLMIVEGNIAEANDMLTFQASCGSCIRYACHLACWDGIEEGTEHDHLVSAFPEQEYAAIPKESLIVFSIRSVSAGGEACSFERLVKECFTLFPKAFSLSRYPQWPDCLKFDRPLRTLRERGWIVGGTKTLFSLTEFGEGVAKDTAQALRGLGLAKKHVQKTVRGVDTALINSLKESSAYRKFLDGKDEFSISEMEVRALLQCTLETPLRVLRQNLQYSRNLAVDYGSGELLEFLRACEQTLEQIEA